MKYQVEKLMCELFKGAKEDWERAKNSELSKSKLNDSNFLYGKHSAALDAALRLKKILEGAEG